MSKKDGIVIGNHYDKYNTRNPVARRMVAGFDRSLSELVEHAAPKSIHEVGCGEGYWSLRFLGKGIPVRGTDFSRDVIQIAKNNAASEGRSADIFEVKSIYDLDPAVDSADVVLCCEVLEHLEEPEKALERLMAISRRELILSVPNEPLWRILNVIRGSYLRDWGNTPGHLNHWSPGKFKKFISSRFRVLESRRPLPWTMLRCVPK